MHFNLTLCVLYLSKSSTFLFIIAISHIPYPFSISYVSSQIQNRLMTMSASPLPSWGNGNASNPQSSMIRTWGVKVFVAITLMTVGSLWILSDGPFGQVRQSLLFVPMDCSSTKLIALFSFLYRLMSKRTIYCVLCLDRIHLRQIMLLLFLSCRV